MLGVKRLLNTPQSRGFVLGWRRNYHDFKSLEESVKATILNNNSRKNIEKSTVITTLNTINLFAPRSDSIELPKLKDLFTRVVGSPNVELDNEIIAKLIKDFDLAVEFIPILFQEFNKRYPSQYIDLSIAKNALRKSLYDTINLEQALKIVSTSTGSENYIGMLRNKRNKLLFNSFGAGLGSLTAIDLGLRALDSNPRYGVYAMALTYIVNMGFFATLAFGSRFKSHLQFIKYEDGESSNNKFLHSDEMKMLDKIAELDIKLNGVDGFASENFVKRLEKKNLKTIQPETDYLLQEYWLTSGANFEWVEPEQDPADIIWTESLEHKDIRLIENDIAWTEKLIEGRERSEIQPQ